MGSTGAGGRCLGSPSFQRGLIVTDGTIVCTGLAPKIPAKPDEPTVVSISRSAAFTDRSRPVGPSCSNTRATIAGGSSGRSAADLASPDAEGTGDSMLAPTATKDVTSWRLPSSKTVKSSAVSPATGRCCLSRTTTSTTTAVVEALNLGSGCCAEIPSIGRMTDIANRSATCCLPVFIAGPRGRTEVRPYG